MRILEVQLKVTRFSAFSSSILQAARGLSYLLTLQTKLNDAIKESADNAKALGKALKDAGRGGGSSSGGGARTPDPNKTGKFRVEDLMPAGGPFSALRRAILQARKFPHDPDVQFRLRQAQMNAQAAQKLLRTPPWVHTLQQHLQHIRIGGGILGGGGMLGAGIIGNLGNAVNLFSQFGKLGLVVGAAAVGIGLLSAGVNQAVQAVNAFRQSLVSGAGTAGQTLQADAIGRALGLPLSEMVSMARAFNERRANDPFTMAYFGAAAPAPFRDPNDIRPLLQAVERLEQVAKGPGGMQEATRRARQAGIEPILNLMFLSPETRAKLESEARLREKIFGSDTVLRNASEFSVQLGRMKDSFLDVITTGIQPFVPMFTSLFSHTADFFQMIHRGMLGIKSIADAIVGNAFVQTLLNAGASIKRFAEQATFAGGLIRGAGYGIAVALAFITKGPVAAALAALAAVGIEFGILNTAMSQAEKNAQNHTNALNAQNAAAGELSDSMNELASVMRNMRGVFGGGERARGILPTAFRGPYMGQPGLEGQAALYGVFAL